MQARTIHPYTVDREIFAVKFFLPVALVAKIKHAKNSMHLMRIQFFAMWQKLISQKNFYAFNTHTIFLPCGEN